MRTRILIIHPMGTDMYNEWTLEVLGPAAAPGTEIGVRHLPGLPETPFVPDTGLWREAFFEAVIAAETDGFDVVATACTSDPLVGRPSVWSESRSPGRSRPSPIPRRRWGR